MPTEASDLLAQSMSLQVDINVLKYCIVFLKGQLNCNLCIFQWLYKILYVKNHNTTCGTENMNNIYSSQDETLIYQLWSERKHLLNRACR